MRCLKVGALPAKADPEQQEEYKQEKLEPRLEEAKQGKRAVFFADAAHFVMGAFLGMIWCNHASIHQISFWPQKI